MNFVLEIKGIYLFVLYDYIDRDIKKNYEMYIIEKYIVFGILMFLFFIENRLGF